MNSPATIQFGSPEFWGKFQSRFEPVLGALSGHEAALNGLVDRAYDNLEGWQLAVLNLARLTGVGMMELLTLAANGFGHGAMKILRSVMENTIDAEFLRLNPTRFGEFLEWEKFERWKVYGSLIAVNPVAEGQLGAEELTRAKEEHEQVRDSYRLRGRSSSRWCGINLGVEAEEANLAALYKIVNPISTRLLHGGMFALLLHFDPKADPHRIDVPPAMTWCQQALVGGECCVRQTIGTLSQAVNIEPQPSVRELAEQSRAAWANVAAAEFGRPGTNNF